MEIDLLFKPMIYIGICPTQQQKTAIFFLFFFFSILLYFEVCSQKPYRSAFSTDFFSLFIFVCFTFKFYWIYLNMLDQSTRIEIEQIVLNRYRFLCYRDTYQRRKKRE